MKLLYFPLLLTAVVAEPIMVYTSRSVAQQIGMGSCFPHAGSNIRAQRFTQPLTPGEYKFLANVTQTISILEAGCKTVSSSVQSFVWFGDELVAGKSTLAQGCKPISTTDSIEGMFTVREEGPVHLVLHTQGGICARVTGHWNDITLMRCADRLPKVERQLERSMAEMTKASKAFGEATTEEERAALKQVLKEARSQVNDLKQEMQWALTC